MERDQLRFEGTALCFDSEEEAFEAVRLRAYKPGDVIVVRYEGPKGGPGMREMLSTTAAIYGQSETKGKDVALITDGRFSGRDAWLLRRSCRAGGGGRRTDRAAAQRRPDRHRRGEGQHRRNVVGCGARRAAGRLAATQDRLQCGRNLEIRAIGGSCASRRGDASGCRGGNALLRGYLTEAIKATRGRQRVLPRSLPEGSVGRLIECRARSSEASDDPLWPTGP